MKVTRTEQGWTIQVPDDVMQALGLRDGDEVRVERGKTPAEQVVAILATRTEADRARSLANMDRIAKLSYPLPSGYRFDREEANQRR